ncbi:MAG: hypothetical protein M1820_006095 [Bogoriella megaspora]|nr:MAG: hypothetical protein M1820_006095 [Bogoriella megaspora]
MGTFCLLHVLARDGCLRKKEKKRDTEFMQELSSRDGVFEALSEMMRRLWWNRQWVIQETVLPPLAVVHYGRFTLPWDMLSSALKSYQTHHDKTCCNTDYAKLRTSDTHALENFVRTVRSIDRWRTVWRDHSEAPVKLLQLLWQFRSRNTGRPKDKIYALIPLVTSWAQQKPLDVHYDWDVANIFVDLVPALVDVENSLLILMGTTQKTQDPQDPALASLRPDDRVLTAASLSRLPTWVPDWTKKPDAHELARLERTPLYHAFGPLLDENGSKLKDHQGKVKPKFDLRDNIRFYNRPGADYFEILEVRGKIHDKLTTSIGGEMPSIDATNPTTAQETARNVRETFAAWAHLASTDTDPQLKYLGGPSTQRNAFYRTLCMDTVHEGSENDDDNLPLDRKDYQRTDSRSYARDFDTRIRQVGITEGTGQSPNEEDYRFRFQGNNTATWGTTIRSPEKINEITGVNNATTSATTYRKFFVSEQGYMGLGPPEMQDGDLIVVLVGGHTPFIIRKANKQEVDANSGRKQCYTLIGDCYVHGIMDGEAMKDVQEEGQLEQFFLV